jgi:hypothetical protein
MKHFDNSREGNDCWIHEHWYWHDEMDGFVVRVTEVRGWSETAKEASVFTGVNTEMPEVVLVWFRERAAS